MQKITFVPTHHKHCTTHIQDYLKRLTAPFDTYLETFIFRSDFYNITLDDLSIGYYAVCDSWVLTQFHVVDEQLPKAADILTRIIQKHGLDYALVPTGDTPLLDWSKENYARSEVRTLSYTESDADVPPPEYPREMLSLVKPEDWERVHRATDNLFDVYGKQLDDDMLYEIYEFKDGDEVLGYGLREEVRLFPGYQEIGVFTMPNHRQYGVGRSILLHLKDICHEAGKKVLTGCWFYNRKAKSALNSAGFEQVSQIKRVYF